MSNGLKITVAAATIAFHAIGCLATAEPTPLPTATPDIGAMVRAAIGSALDRTVPPEPVPTATPTQKPSPTPEPTPTDTPVPPTPTVSFLPTADCSNCVTSHEPAVSLLTWDQIPTIGVDGILRFRVSAPQQVNIYSANHGNITVHGESSSRRPGNPLVNNRKNTLLGTIYPPKEPGWIYHDDDSDFTASEYNHFHHGLSVVVQMPLAAITHPGLYICIWTDTLDINNSEILGCKSVRQP